MEDKKKISGNLQWNWIRAHTNNIDLPYELNDIADQHAKECQSMTTSEFPSQLIHYAEIEWKGRTMLNTSFLKEVHHEDIRNYFCQRWEWSPDQHDMILWKYFGYVVRASGIAIRTFLAKISTGWLPTNVHMAKYTDTLETCASCGLQKEDMIHMFTCHVNLDTDKMNTFRKTMTNLKTDPSITKVWLHYFAPGSMSVSYSSQSPHKRCPPPSKELRTGAIFWWKTVQSMDKCTVRIHSTSRLS